VKGENTYMTQSQSQPQLFLLFFHLLLIITIPTLEGRLRDLEGFRWLPSSSEEHGDTTLSSHSSSSRGRILRLPSPITTLFNKKEIEKDKKRMGGKESHFLLLPVPGIVSLFLKKISDDVRFHKLSITQYQDQMMTNFKLLVDNFKNDQSETSFKAQREFKAYSRRMERLYKDLSERLESQNAVLDELNAYKVLRPKQIDESLEQFRRIYNEKILTSIPSSPASLSLPSYLKDVKFPRRSRKTKKKRIQQLQELQSLLQSKLQIGRKDSDSSTYWYSLATSWFRSCQKLIHGDKERSEVAQSSSAFGPTASTAKTAATAAVADEKVGATWLSLEPFSNQMEQLQTLLRKSWETASQQGGGVTSSEESIRLALADFNKFQEDLTFKARSVTASSQELIRKALDKNVIRREQLALEENLRKLEREGNLWLEERKQNMELVLKSLQEKMQTTNLVYEELISRRRESLKYTSMSDAILNNVLSILDTKNKRNGWKLIKEEDGYQVYRKFMTPGMPGSQYACVLCHGYINAAAPNVLALFEDDTRIQEYNSFYATGRDLETVAENTKISWASSPPVFPFKPRDFVTLVHIRKLKDGTVIVLNKGVSHPDAPITSNYVRGEIVLAANIIKPVSSKKCHLTMITQMDPGGFAPPAIINHICTLGPTGFLRNVESASNRRRSRKELEEERKKLA